MHRIDLDNPAYTGYYQHDTREEYDESFSMSSKYMKSQMVPSPYDRMQPHMMMGSPQQRHPHPPSMNAHHYDSPYPANYKYNKFNNNNNDGYHQQPMMMNRMGSFDGSQNNNNNNNSNSMFSMMFETQPQILSFKNFLQNLNQNLTPEQATKRYNEYKNNFRKDQIELFFDAHKEEEWFKFRYHPDESVKRKEEYRNAIKRRLNIFMDLYEKKYLDNVYVDMDNYEELKKFICAVIIKLEDGSDEDLKMLDAQEEVEVEAVKVDDVKKEDKDLKNDPPVEVKATNSNYTVNSDDENADYDKDDLVCIENNNKNNNVDNNESDKESGMCSESDSSSSESDREEKIKSDGESDGEKKKKKKKVKKEKSSARKASNESEEVASKKPIAVNTVQITKPKIQIQKRVQSIFFKNLPVNTSRLELEEV